jgi:hypothetical protein
MAATCENQFVGKLERRAGDVGNAANKTDDEAPE